MARRKNWSAEQIIAKLRQIEIQIRLTGILDRVQ